MKKTLLLFSLFILFNGAHAQLQVSELRCEYLVDPLGIDTRMPRLSWKLKSPARNQRQEACEWQLALSAEELIEQRRILYSSPRIAGSLAALMEYAGPRLQSFQRYYWRVRVYDQQNRPSAWSKPAYFETAMLDSTDWQASWISDGSSKPATDSDYYLPDRAPLFRKSFRLSAKPVSARLYISGLGYYEAFMNGKKLGNRVLDPGFTTVARQVLYSCIDITGNLVKGNNTASVRLGNGWWNPLPFKLFGRWDLRDYQQTGRPQFIAEIHLQYADGRRTRITTNTEWETAPGPILRNNIYLGEEYDARLEQVNWHNSQPDHNWQPASLATAPAGRLTAQMQPPIRITRILNPVAVTRMNDSVFMVDMGQNFAGTARIKVQGARGTCIRMRFGEALFADSSLNVMTSVATQLKHGQGGPGSPQVAWQEDRYTLKGGKEEQWSPAFVFHGFRYIEVKGWPGQLKPENIEGLRMNADLPLNGQFTCSNTLLNRIHEAVQWTFLSNLFSVQSDCPAREKMGYGADMVVTANAFCYNYDMAQFYAKAVTDFANEQRPQGGITEIAPFTGIADKGQGDGSGPLGWQLAFPFLQLQLYDFYGDRRIIENNYPALQRQLAFLKSKAPNLLFYWDISDHEALDEKPEALTASLFYYEHLVLATRIAGILGKPADSLEYHQQALAVQSAILDSFYHSGTGRWDNGTQTAQLFGLYYGFAPEPELSVNLLLQELERRNWHLTTGIFATRYFLEVMRKLNRNDIAYRVVNQRSAPGWGSMLEKGFTTLVETWGDPGTVYSCNHPMFGSIDEWFYRSLLGINAAGPGFSRMLIQPQPTANLSWARGSLQTSNGEIRSEWRREGDRFRVMLSIPANTIAEVRIAANKGSKLIESGKAWRNARYESGFFILETGGGEYVFETNWTAQVGP